MCWFLFILLLFLTLSNYLRAKKLFLHPSVLACGVFTVSSLVMALNSEKWKYDISLITLLYIFSALIFFTIGVNIGESNKYERERGIRPKYDVFVSINKLFLFFFYIISLLVTYMYYRHQYAASVSLGNNLGLAGMLLYLRQSTVFDADNEVLQLSTSLNLGIAFVKAFSNLCLYILILKIINKEKDWTLYIFPIICLFIVYILTTGRGSFISFVSAVIFDIFIITKIKGLNSKNKKIMRYSIISVSLFFVLFYLLGSLTGRGEISLNDTVSIYVGSSIVCLDYMLTHGWDNSPFGIHTFKGIYGIIGRFFGGADSTMLSNHGDMVRWSEYSSNVYSSFAPYIIDFGLIGSLLVIFLVGILFGFLWKLYLNKGILSFLSVIYGGMFGYALCMFSIAERILSQYIALNVLAQLFILQILLTYFIKKKRLEIYE